jgi:uncharacterized DUF497 family protein
MKDAFAFDWNEANVRHIAYRDVTPAEIEQAFANEVIDIDYEVLDAEERWTSMGHTNQLRVLVIVWTMRDETIRPITAREVTKRRSAEYLALRGV